MRERKYSLPRHTNLASNGSRTGAFLIDFVISAILTIGLFYGVFSNIFRERNEKLTNTLNEERYASHLFFKDENGELDSHGKDTPNQRFVDDIVYFYTEYLDEKQSIEWVNVNIFQVDGKGKDFFAYQTTNEVQDKTKIAVFKDGASEQETNVYLQQASDYAINYTFNTIPEVKKMIRDEQFSYQLTFILALLPSVLFTYLLVPYMSKDGSTFGKKAFGLGLASSDGYKFKKWQLLLRMVPLIVVIASLFIPIWSNLLVLLIVFLTIFLVSFALSMASPKRMALHDFCANTIVINSKSSVIFEDEIEEEKYLLEEEGEEEKDGE